jgi:hypothetical protein
MQQAFWAALHPSTCIKATLVSRPPAMRIGWISEVISAQQAVNDLAP